MPRLKVKFDDFTRHFYQVVQLQLYAQAWIEAEQRRAQEQVQDRQNWGKKYYESPALVSDEFPSANTSI